MPRRHGALIDGVSRALLALLALMILLLPVPLGDGTASAEAGPSCCALPLDSIDADVEACPADCPDCAPSLADDADGTRHPCCAEGCHCACCGALPIALAGPGSGPVPCLVRPAPTRQLDARADQVPFTIFVPPRA